MYLLITFIASFFVIIVSNILTRVGLDSTTFIYDNFPTKFTLRNKTLLKLYIVYPKSMITKSSFVLYFISIVSFVIIAILGIVQLASHILDEKLIGLVYLIFMISSYIISYGFDICVAFAYKRKNILTWDIFYERFVKNKESFNFIYKKYAIYLKYETSKNKIQLLSCHYVKSNNEIEIKTFKSAKDFLNNAKFDNKKFEDIFYDLKLLNNNK